MSLWTKKRLWTEAGEPTDPVTRNVALELRPEDATIPHLLTAERIALERRTQNAKSKIACVPES